MVALTTDVADRFAAFHVDDLQQFRVRLRRHRSAQIRELLSRPDDLTLDIFNREVWRLEAGALVDGQPIRVGEIFDLQGMSERRRIELDDALIQGRLVFHGNSIWGSGTRVYGEATNLVFH